MEEETFVIPAHKEGVKIFRADALNKEELSKDLASSTVFSEFQQRVTVSINRIIMKQPILPLKSTLDGVAVASGAIGGNLGTHIVSGVTKPITRIHPIYDDEGKFTGEKHVKFHTSAVRIFTQNGVHELI